MNHIRSYADLKEILDEYQTFLEEYEESKKDLPERAELALSHDPLCLEAFFVYYLLSEDVFVNYRFRSYYDQISHFGDLSDYQKKCYLKILDFYVEFLLDIGKAFGELLLHVFVKLCDDAF